MKSWSETLGVAQDVVLGRYPMFVYGRGNQPGEVPVFCFHSAEPESFEAMLQYLEANRYHTLTADEYYLSHSERDRSGIERPVVLTFDDGMGSVWSVAYPLLKKYGFRATVFLIPGKITEGSGCGPTLEGVWNGRHSIEEVAGRDIGDQPLATWEEIEEMHRSGLIDFQSHTLSHSLVFTSPRITEFVHPSCLETYHPHEFPASICEVKRDRNYSVPKLGTPLYTSAPRMSGAVRYFDDAGLREACVRYVDDHGGEKFFASRHWRAELNRFAERYQETHGPRGRYEIAGEREAAMREELGWSREMIENRLSGKKVRHLCYPWEVACPEAVEMSKAFGYRSSYWGRINHRRLRRYGLDPFRIGRMGEDFFFLLPGKGRGSLGSVLAKKVGKRARKGSPYLAH